VGGLYLLLLVGYMYLSVRWARAHPELLPEEVLEGRPAGRPAARKIGTAVAAGMLIVLVSLLLVVAGSTVLVGSVKVLALRYGVPSDILAVTIVAFGTSLPEMVTSVTAVLKGHGELAVGNVIGADILNVLFVVGASSLAVPLHVPQTFFFLHLPIMTAALGVMAFYLYFTRGEHFHRWQGLPLLGVYAAYVVLLLIFLRSAVA
jgi:cation:H+ antiporter